ncbi:MAG: M48 family metallopeptidase [Candidatus Omnitrophica bacterium]|nr:M48 family metallopeptidase [Candidatus Omnitrophota bacterium]
MNIYLFIILFVLVGIYLLNLSTSLLNISSANPQLPKEFKDLYDPKKYYESQNYLKDNSYFKIIQSTVINIIIIYLILTGGFNSIDQFVRSFNLEVIPTGLFFIVIIFFGAQIINLPFSIYDTFFIEEKYGFNRTTIKTFIFDLLKGWILSIILGGIIFSGILWFFIKTGNWAWFWCWTGVTIFEVFLLFIAPVLIMPIFNKFLPLEEGELKEAIEKYSKHQNFKMKGIFTMDGSKRSTKSNAFFTGFGKYRRIVLFDTLIEKHSVSELVSILAHEIGHYKKKHILQQLIISIVTNGIMFIIMSLFIKNVELFAAFKMQDISVYAGLLFFGFLYAPINVILSICLNYLSRKNEYQADSYAIKTFNEPEAFISALKKMSIDNLSNLTPHPLKVFLDYSHPPVLKRIETIRLRQI